MCIPRQSAVAQSYIFDFVPWRAETLKLRIFLVRGAIIITRRRVDHQPREAAITYRDIAHIAAAEGAVLILYSVFPTPLTGASLSGTWPFGSHILLSYRPTLLLWRFLSGQQLSIWEHSGVPFPAGQSWHEAE